MRAMTIWVYLSAVVLAAVLSVGPPTVRVGLGVVWGLLSVGAGAWCVVAGARLERGRLWASAGLCASCAYPLSRWMRVCPECGRRAGQLPDGQMADRRRI